MKKNVFSIFVFALLIWSCSTPEEPKTTILSFYTSYNFTPEFLNGQLKTVQELSYWATESDGSYEKGAKLTAQELQELGWTLDCISSFDRDGNVVKTKYLMDDNLFETWDIESMNGNMVKATFTSNDTARTYQMIDYEGSNMVVSAFKLPEDELTRHFNITTNEAGIANKLEMFNPKDELLSYFLYELNDANRVIGYKRYNAQDSLLSFSELTYNDKGFFTKHTTFDGEGNVLQGIELEYLTYDDHGNWLTVTGAAFDGPKLFFERDYEYY